MCSLIAERCAISRLDKPSASSASTSRSRAVSDSISGSPPHARPAEPSFVEAGADRTAAETQHSASSARSTSLEIANRPRAASQRVELALTRGREEHSERTITPELLGRSLTVTVTIDRIAAAQHRDRHRGTDLVAAQQCQQRSGSSIASPSKPTITSPTSRPPLSAGLSPATLLTSRPCVLRSSGALSLGQRHRHRTDAEEALARAALARPSRAAAQASAAGMTTVVPRIADASDDAERAAVAVDQTRRRSARHAAAARCG